MASLKQYTTKSGRKKWKVTVFAGRDPQTGKKKYIVRGGFDGPDGKKKAAIVGDKLELAVNNGDLPGKKKRPMLFRDVYVEWYDGYVNGVRESTLVQTLGYFKRHILPAFGDKRIATITNNDVQRAVNRWAKEAPASYRTWFSYVRMVFAHALKQNYMRGNDPTAFVTKPRREDGVQTKRHSFWTPEQMQQFFSCIDERTERKKYTVFRVYAYTGMRRSELLALEWSDIDFEQGTISINKTLAHNLEGRVVVDPPKTRSSNRVIATDAKTMDILLKWKKFQESCSSSRDLDHQVVFPGQRGKYMALSLPITWLNRIIKDNHLQPIVVHGFRHSLASNMINSDVPVTSVTQVVGHANPSTTLKIYSHADPQQAKKATTALAHILDGQHR